MARDKSFPQQVLVTGGTGFIGGHLISALLLRGARVTVLSRLPREASPGVTYVQSLQDVGAPAQPFAVVNLAGEPLNSGRWNERRKRLFRDSRVDLTSELVSWMGTCEQPPSAMVSASAVGWYGHRGDEVLTETSSGAPGFSHDLCAAWESAARSGLPEQTRSCVLRIGVVLGADGGSLPVMLGTARLGLGGPFGSGQQWWSWIHINDLVEMILWLLETPSCSGVFNGTAPEPVRQRDFAKTLGSVLHRPAFLPLPGVIARLMLGEFAEEVLLNGQRVEPERARALGFQFAFPALKSALDDLLG